MGEQEEKKKWSTKKVTLFFTIISVVIYVILDCYITFANAYTGTAIYFDSTLTTEFFDYMKWIAGIGGGLQATGLITDTVKDVLEDTEAKG